MKGSTERISLLNLLPRTIRQFSGRNYSYLAPRKSLQTIWRGLYPRMKQSQASDGLSVRTMIGGINCQK